MLLSCRFLPHSQRVVGPSSFHTSALVAFACARSEIHDVVRIIGRLQRLGQEVGNFSSKAYIQMMIIRLRIPLDSKLPRQLTLARTHQSRSLQDMFPLQFE